MTDQLNADREESSGSDWSDLQMLWQAEAKRTKLNLSIDELAVAAGRRADELRTVVKWRDYREIGISLLMIPIWIWIGVASGQVWTWYLTLIAIVWGAGYQIYQRRRQLHIATKVPPDASYLDTLKENRRQSQFQINHLSSVLWWYLLPYGIPLIIYFIHIGWNISRSWAEFTVMSAIWIGFVIGLYYYLYRLNLSVAQNNLMPQRDAMDQLIRQLEDGQTEIDDQMAESLAAIEKPACNWVQNWNQMIPSWSVAGLIVAATVLGFVIGYLLPLPFDWPRWCGGGLFANTGFCLTFFPNRYWQFRRRTQGTVVDHGRLRGPAAFVFALLFFVVAITLAVFFQLGKSLIRDRTPQSSPELILAPDEILPGDPRGIDFWLEDLVADQFPSLSVAIVREGQIDYLRAFGWADIDEKIAADPQTPYNVASVTKALTGTLAAILHEREIVDLDKPLVKYLPPKVQVSNTPAVGSQITLRHLATHTSGLPRDIPGKVQSTEGAYALEPERLYRQLADVSLNAPPGQNELYSNLGFELLGHALENATQKSFGELIQEHIAGPLEMNFTFIPESGSTSRRDFRVATGYARTFKIRHEQTRSMQSRLAGSGGLVSSAECLAKFLIANMEPGGLSGEAMQLAHQPTTLQDGSMNDSGLGWSIRRRADIGEVIKKNGGRINCSAWIGFSPQHRIGVVVLTNSGEKSVDEIGYRLLEAAVPLDDRSLIVDGKYVKVTPFNAVRWDNDDRPSVRVNRLWISLTSIDETPIRDVIRFAKQRYGDQYRKRFSEDFVEVMFEMGKPIQWKVALGYRRNDGTEGQLRRMMTAADRNAVREANRQ